MGVVKVKEMGKRGRNNRCHTGNCAQNSSTTGNKICNFPGIDFVSNFLEIPNKKRYSIGITSESKDLELDPDSLIYEQISFPV